MSRGLIPQRKEGLLFDVGYYMDWIVLILCILIPILFLYEVSYPVRAGRIVQMKIDNREDWTGGLIRVEEEGCKYYCRQRNFYVLKEVYDRFHLGDRIELFLGPYEPERNRRIAEARDRQIRALSPVLYFAFIFWLCWARRKDSDTA